MISAVNSNVAFQGAVVQNGQQYRQPVNNQVVPDTAEFAGKKKSSKAKKGIIGTIIGVAVAAAALYAGVKSGKLTEVKNASKWTEKLQNLAFKGGSYIDQGVKYVSKKGADVVDWCKDKMPSKNKVKETASAVTESVIEALPDKKYDLVY